MLRSSLSGLAGLLLLSAFSVGCIGGGDLVADETDVATDELSLRGWEPLIGAWVGSTGPFQGLVITRTTVGQGRHFFADVDTGIRCITTPCPSQAHLEGRVTAGTRNLTLRHPDRPSPEAARFYGTYAYTLNGSTLTLAQNGRIVARLRKATSYCSDADQCAEQRLITPRCLGRFECESNACRYRCGQPPRPTCASTTCAAGHHLRRQRRRRAVHHRLRHGPLLGRPPSASPTRAAPAACRAPAPTPPPTAPRARCASTATPARRASPAAPPSAAPRAPPASPTRRACAASPRACAAAPPPAPRASCAATPCATSARAPGCSASSDRPSLIPSRRC